MDNNVAAFNELVRLQSDLLIARGESSNNIMINLFKGYPMATDK